MTAAMASPPMLPDSNNGWYAIAEVVAVCRRTDAQPVYAMRLAGTTSIAIAMHATWLASLRWWVGDRFLVRLAWSEEPAKDISGHDLWKSCDRGSVYLPSWEADAPDMRPNEHIGFDGLSFRDFDDPRREGFGGRKVIGMAPIDEEDTSTLAQIAARGWPPTTPRDNAPTLRRHLRVVLLFTLGPDRTWQPFDDWEVIWGKGVAPPPPGARVGTTYAFIATLVGSQVTRYRSFGALPERTDHFWAEVGLAAGHVTEWQLGHYWWKTGPHEVVM